MRAEKDKKRRYKKRVHGEDVQREMQKRTEDSVERGRNGWENRIQRKRNIKM